MKVGQIGYPETSVRNYQYSLRHNPKERISHLLRGGSLKTCILPFGQTVVEMRRTLEYLRTSPTDKGKGKGKGLPRTGHEDPEGEQMYSSTLPSTSALDGGGWSTPRPGRFNPGKDPVSIV